MEVMNLREPKGKGIYGKGWREQGEWREVIKAY